MSVPVDSDVYHQAGIEISVGLRCTALRFRLTLGQSPKGGCIFISPLRHCIRRPPSLQSRRDNRALLKVAAQGL